jgi:hypothetical protein
MCQYHTLYHDADKGYVVRCEDCGRLQLGFGNLILTFSLEDFEAFRCWMLRIRSEQEVVPNPCLRNIVIPSPCEGVKLVLSLRELDEFNHMLEAADTERRSLDLIELFQQH